MTARDDEAETLARCALAAGGFVSVAVNQREANVFRLASMVSQSRFPVESTMLLLRPHEVISIQSLVSRYRAAFVNTSQGRINNAGKRLLLLASSERLASSAGSVA